MPTGGESVRKYPHENPGGGQIYSVDDVSDLLGIPRPTLYRYLREYSIPHLRQGGRIHIPEDSFDRIREARDLHKEGLGTESVRRQIREGTGPKTSDLNERLNQLHDTLRDLRGDLQDKPATTGELALSPALRTILARQSMMLSAMFNLTGMVEDLLLSNGKARRRSVQRFDEDLSVSVAENQLPATIVAEHAPIRRSQSVEIEPSNEPSRTRFGSLARRRRRGVLAIAPVIMLVLLILFLIPTFMDREDPATANGSTPNGATDNQPDGRPAAGETNNRGGAPDDSGNAGDGAGEVAAANEASPEETAPPAEEDPATAPTSSDGGIPDVSGQPLEEAAKTISEAGYTVSAVMIAPGPGEPGTVTGTEPASGTEVPPDTAIVLTMRPDATGASSASPTPASASASADASPTSASASPSP